VTAIGGITAKKKKRTGKVDATMDFIAFKRIEKIICI